MLRRKREVVASDMETLLCREGRMRPNKIADWGAVNPPAAMPGSSSYTCPCDTRENVTDAGHW